MIYRVLKVPVFALVSAASASALGLLYYFTTISAIPANVQAASQIPQLYVPLSVAMTVIIASLGGVNTALILYRMQGHRLSLIRRPASSLSTLGSSSLAVFTLGCPLCTTPLTVILATAGGLALLPLQGLEFKLVSIAVLGLSMMFAARSISHQNIVRNKGKEGS